MVKRFMGNSLINGQSVIQVEEKGFDGHKKRQHAEFNPREREKFWKMIRETDGKNPRAYRIEILLTPEGHSRLKRIKKDLGKRNQNEVIEALLLKAIGEEKIPVQLTEEIAENVLLILERFEELA